MNKLREIRFLKGLTQIELEKKSGIHRTTISPIEAGYIEPSSEQKMRLAHALEVPLTDIWPIKKPDERRLKRKTLLTGD